MRTDTKLLWGATLVLAFGLLLLGACARKPRSAQILLPVPVANSWQIAETGTQPTSADSVGWEEFWQALRDEDEASLGFMLKSGFEVGRYAEELGEMFYFEIYHSIAGFESRYLDGPLSKEQEAYYQAVEDRLLRICRRLRDLGLPGDYKGDWIAAAEFREFPRLVAWLESEY